LEREIPVGGGCQLATLLLIGFRTTVGVAKFLWNSEICLEQQKKFPVAKIHCSYRKLSKEVKKRFTGLIFSDNQYKIQFKFFA
jgi:hypothetical protein